MTGPRSRPAPRSTALRWAVAAAVLLAAVVIAGWPLAHVPWLSPDRGSGGPPAQDLAALRDRAALAPCPAAPAAGPAGPAASAPPAGPLAGVSVPCLGDGAPVPLGAALAGRETLLNVWSHTCRPCRDELPALQEYAARGGAVPVLGVQVDGSRQDGLAMLAAIGVRLPSVADPDGALRAVLSAPPVLPLSYLVSADGSVRLLTPPRVFRSAGDVDTAVRQLRAGA